jgi:exosome complex RNA-binding protein Csl4
LLALARHDGVGIARCTVCGGVRVRDLLGKRTLTCANCEAAIDNTVKAPPC